MLKLRAVTPDDAEALGTLHRRAFDHGGWSDAQLQGSLDLATTHGWAIHADGRLIGFILYQLLPDETEILTIAVDPAHRRQGIGRKLLATIISAISGQTALLRLEVAANNVAACGLYESAGFSVAGRRPHYYQHPGGAVDALLMTCALAPFASPHTP